MYMWEMSTCEILILGLILEYSKSTVDCFSTEAFKCFLAFTCPNSIYNLHLLLLSVTETIQEPLYIFCNLFWKWKNIGNYFYINIKLTGTIYLQLFPQKSISAIKIAVLTQLKVSSFYTVRTWTEHRDLHRRREEQIRNYRDHPG